MNSPQITPAESRRRKAEKNRQRKLNEKLLKQCGFWMTYGTTWTTNHCNVTFDTEEEIFSSLDDVTSAIYERGQHDAKQAIRKALE